MPRLLERINFPKVVATLAILFVVALGACGLTALASNNGSAGFFVPLGLIELAAMGLSLIGLVAMLILWIVAAILGQTHYKESAPQHLFDSSKDDDKSSPN